MEISKIPRTVRNVHGTKSPAIVVFIKNKQQLYIILLTDNYQQCVLCFFADDDRYVQRGYEYLPHRMPTAVIIGRDYGKMALPKWRPVSQKIAGLFVP